MADQNVDIERYTGDLRDRVAELVEAYAPGEQQNVYKVSKGYPKLKLQRQKTKTENPATTIVRRPTLDVPDNSIANIGNEIIRLYSNMPVTIGLLLVHLSVLMSWLFRGQVSSLMACTKIRTEKKPVMVKGTDPLRLKKTSSKTVQFHPVSLDQGGSRPAAYYVFRQGSNKQTTFRPRPNHAQLQVRQTTRSSNHNVIPMTIRTVESKNWSA